MRDGDLCENCAYFGVDVATVLAKAEAGLCRKNPLQVFIIRYILLHSIADDFH